MGIVEKWLPEMEMWGVSFSDLPQEAYREDDSEAMCEHVAPGVKVTVAERIEILADPDDPGDCDRVVERDTRGVIRELDADGDMYIEFESRPGEALPIDKDGVSKL